MQNGVKREPWKYRTDKADNCPFCGSNSISVCHAQVRYIGHNCFGAKKIKMKAYCMCNKCYAKGKPVTYIGYTDLSAYDEEHLPIYCCGDKAIESWNTRKPMERIVKQLEEEYNKWADIYDIDKFHGVLNEYAEGKSDALKYAIDIVERDGIYAE